VISPAHARVLAQGTRHLPDHLTRDAEPVLVEAARRLDPPSCVKRSDICSRRRTRRGLTPPASVVMSGEGCGRRRPGRAWSPSTGCWRRRPAPPCWPPSNPSLVRLMPPTTAAEASAMLMPWPSWPVGAWRVGGCPRRVGSDPSCSSPSTSTACWAAPAASAETWAGPDPWTPRPAGDSPATGRSPGS
jgi:hypothetical protein